MNIKVLEGLKKLQKNITLTKSVQEDPFMDTLNDVANELYNNEPINLDDYREQNITKK